LNKGRNPHRRTSWKLHRVSEKNKKNCFCYNYVKLPPNLTIFGTMMTNSLKLYEVLLFSTSPKLCRCITMLNTDVPNSYVTVKIAPLRPPPFIFLHLKFFTGTSLGA